MSKDLKFAKPALILLLAAIAIAASLKLGLVLANRVPFNSDQAIVGLMARHILNGERPIFFYGQAYMGSLDAWLVAAGFRIFGEAAWVINLVQGLLYGGTIFTTAWIGWKIFEDARIGLVAAWLLAMPTVNVTLYTTISGYGEALLLGNLMLLTALKIGRQLRSFRLPARYLWLLLGFIFGLGFWLLGLTIVYAVPVCIYLILTLYRYYRTGIDHQHLWRKYAISLAAVFSGAIMGSFPWWVYAFEHGFGQLISELSGGASTGLPLPAQIGQHLLNLVVLGSTVIFGFRPPWTLVWLGLPLAPFVIAFWVAVLVWTAKAFRLKDDRKPEKFILLGIMLTLAIAFVISPFGGDPSGRYFLPFAVPLALFAGDLIIGMKIRYGNLALGLVALIVVHNLWGTVEGIQSFPKGITTRFDVVTQINQRTIHDLISFLEQQGEARGYTNYWVSYPLAFLSKEELIFIPRLPYHSDFSYTTRDDRYIPYDPLVASSPRVAYLTTNFPDLDTYLRDRFMALDVHWEEAQIGDFHVFYNLSSRVEPGEIGLGFDNPPVIH